MIKSERLSGVSSEEDAFKEPIVPIRRKEKTTPTKRKNPLRRILTTDFKRGESFNNTKMSTFYEGNGSAKPEDLISAPDFMENAGKDNMTIVSGDKSHMKLKQQISLYSNVDEAFLDKKPKDPYKFIDKKT